MLPSKYFSISTFIDKKYIKVKNYKYQILECNHFKKTYFYIYALLTVINKWTYHKSITNKNLIFNKIKDHFLILLFKLKLHVNLIYIYNLMW